MNYDNNGRLVDPCGGKRGTDFTECENDFKLMREEVENMDIRDVAVRE
jgi:hypothetical protein